MRDFIDALDGIAHLVVDFLQGILRRVHQRHPLFDLRRPGTHAFDGTMRILLDQIDHAADLLRGATGALGQFAHFVGDDREATPLFACARGFNRGVERQQIGLVGDLLDLAGNVTDLGRTLTERLDFFRRLLDRPGQRRDRRACLARAFGAFARHVARIERNFLGRASMLGHFADRHGHFLDRRGGGRRRLALLFGRAMDDVHAGFDLRRRFRHMLRRIGHSLDGRLHRRNEGIHPVHYRPKHVGPSNQQAPLKVTGCQQTLGPVRHLVEITAELRHEKPHKVDRIGNGKAHQHFVNPSKIEAKNHFGKINTAQ